MSNFNVNLRMQNVLNTNTEMQASNVQNYEQTKNTEVSVFNFDGTQNRVGDDAIFSGLKGTDKPDIRIEEMPYIIGTTGPDGVFKPTKPDIRIEEMPYIIGTTGPDGVFKRTEPDVRIEEMPFIGGIIDRPNVPIMERPDDMTPDIDKSKHREVRPIGDEYEIKNINKPDHMIYL